MLQAAANEYDGKSEAGASALIFSETRRRGDAVFLYCEPKPTKYQEKSEGSLSDAGDLALVSQFAEADTADAVVAQISVGTAAELAAVVLASRELRRSLLLENHRFLSHLYVLLSSRRERP